MLRKCMCLLCTLWLLPMVQVSAAEGTVRVIPMWAGEPVAGGSVSIQRIGICEGGRIVLTDGLADWSVEAEDILDGSWNLQSIGSVQINHVEEDQGAVFTALEEGIYWVRQESAAEGFQGFRSFLVSVPESGEWDLLRMPAVIRDGEPPLTGDYPAPIIGAMGIGLSIAFLMVLLDKNSR